MSAALIRRAESASRAYALGVDPRGLERLAAYASKLRNLPEGSEAADRAALALEPLSTTRGHELSTLRRLAGVESRADAVPARALAAWCARGRIRLRRAAFGELRAEAPVVERWLAVVDDAWLQAQARIVLAHAEAWSGGVEVAEAYLLDAIAIADEESLTFTAALARAQLGHVAFHRRDRALSREANDAALDLARRAKMPRLLALVNWSRGWTHAGFDELDEAALSLEMTARVQGGLGEPAPATSVWARLVELHGWRSDDEAALRALRRGLEEAERCRGSGAEIELHAAAVLWLRSRRRDAEAHVQRLVELTTGDDGARAEDALRLVMKSSSGFSRELARPTVQVARDGAWLDVGAGRVDLRRRAAVRRVLAALAEAAEAGRPCSAADLSKAGWANRGTRRDLHSAIWTLRRLGLKRALTTTDDGYALDERLVRVVPS